MKFILTLLLITISPFVLAREEYCGPEQYAHEYYPSPPPEHEHTSLWTSANASGYQSIRILTVSTGPTSVIVAQGNTTNAVGLPGQPLLGGHGLWAVNPWNGGADWVVGGRVIGLSVFRAFTSLGGFPVAIEVPGTRRDCDPYLIFTPEP